jgi:hypothetical protein
MVIAKASQLGAKLAKVLVSPKFVTTNQ